jgi:glycosyltransferase involved in cell wall biosynthesis
MESHIPATSLVIPARNEAARIGTTLDRLGAEASLLNLGEILVVVNGTDDGTAEVVAEAERYSPVPIRLLDSRPGKGRAVRTGMLAATGQIRMYTDADLAVPPGDLARLAGRVADGLDVAFGSREAPGALRVGEPAYRHLSGRIFNAFIRALVLPGVGDSQCGAKAFSAEAVAAIFPECTTDGFGFDVEVLALARRNGFELEEIGVEWHAVAGGTVRVARDAPAMLREVLAVRRRLGRCS